MSCARFEKWIALYAEGDLGERKARRLEAHLAACASCREVAESLAASQAALKGLRAEAVDARTLAQVRRSVLDQIAAEQGVPRSWLGSWLGLAWRYVLAGVAVAIVGATLWPRMHRATPARPVVARAPQPATAPLQPRLTAPAKQTATVAAGRLPDPSELQPAIVAGNRPDASAPARPAIAAARAPKHRRAAPRPKAVTPKRPAVESQPLLVKLETADPNVVIFLLVDQNGG